MVADGHAKINLAPAKSDGTILAQYHRVWRLALVVDGGLTWPRNHRVDRLVGSSGRYS
jgi:hypothetical protein